MFPPEVVFCQVAGGVGRRTSPSPSRLKLTATVLFSKRWAGPLSTTLWAGPISTDNQVVAHFKFFLVFHEVKQVLGIASARACALLSTCVSLSLSAMSELLRASPFEGSVCACGNRYCILERLRRQISASEDPSNVVVKRTCSPAPGVRGGQLVRHHFTFIFISFRATLFLRVWRSKGPKAYPARIISSCVCVPFLWSGTHGTKISFHHHDRRR